MARKYYQGFFKPKNPIKYLGDPTNIIYRSSWELKFFNWCDSNSDVLAYSSEEIVVPYICPTDNKPHRYFVDALVKIKSKEGKVNTYLIEIKPSKQTDIPVYKGRKTKRYLIESAIFIKNQAKWKAAEEYASKRGWKFILLTEFDLGIN